MLFVFYQRDNTLMKIGIVGSGIAGLVSAFRLQQAGHQVTLFEKQPRLGMDAHSLEIELDGRTFRADVPSRMFNELQWPSLLQLYREIDVEFKSVKATQSFSFPNQPSHLNLEFANRPWQAAKALVNTRFRRMAREARRFQEKGTQDLLDSRLETISFSDYLAQREFDQEYVEGFLFPTLSSTVLTCSYEALDRYPARLVLQVLQNLTQAPNLLRSRHGTRDVVSRLTASLKDIRLATTVEQVSKTSSGARVSFQDQEQNFDHVIVATQANHANRIVPNNELHQVFDSFEYEEVSVLVHSDTKLMPNKPENWCTFNMIMDPEHRAAMCSVWLNEFHDEWTTTTPVFQTINPIVSPDPNLILSEARLQRPIVKSNSFESWQQLDRYHLESNRIWYVGSYAHEGVPLLETGVRSSQSVVERITATNASQLH